MTEMNSNTIATKEIWYGEVKTLGERYRGGCIDIYGPYNSELEAIEKCRWASGHPKQYYVSYSKSNL